MVDKPSNGLIVFRGSCGSMPVAGVLLIELLGVIWGVMGGSVLGFAIADAPNTLV